VTLRVHEGYCDSDSQYSTIVGVNDTGDPITPPSDGRRARRARGRVAVTDAMLALLQEGKIPPSAEMVAERAGVSVASLFRYFDGLADLQTQAYERFRERYASIVAVPDEVRSRSQPERIEALIEARLDLYEQAGGMMLVGRLRSLEHEPLVAASAAMRGALADQVRSLLGADASDGSPGGIAGLVAVVDALTSLESWDVMCRTHGRSRSDVAELWRSAITAILAARAGDVPTDDPAGADGRRAR
jgi:TetR/AcrR family transcriptional regulator of autoinduction and epiphytic fitness